MLLTFFGLEHFSCKRAECQNTFTSFRNLWFSNFFFSCNSENLLMLGNCHEKSMLKFSLKINLRSKKLIQKLQILYELYQLTNLMDTEKDYVKNPLKFT